MSSYYPCYCSKCSKFSRGYDYQTRQTINDHQKRYSNKNGSLGHEKTRLPDAENDPPSPGPSTLTAIPELPRNGNIDILGDHDTNLGGREEGIAEGSDDSWWNGDPHEGTADLDIRTNVTLERIVEDEHVPNDNYQADEPFIPSQEPADEEEPPREEPEDPQLDPLAEIFAPVTEPDVALPTANTDDTHSIYDRPAFWEKPEVRLAYLNAAIGNVYRGLTVQQAEDVLNSQLNSLLIAGVLPDRPRPVRCLISAKRCLGIDSDAVITSYFACPVCWKHYHPKEVDDLESPSCTVSECNGILFDEKRAKNGERKLEPRLLIPHTSIIETLRRFFMRPGFAAKIRDSRGHIPGQNEDSNFMMRDMSDADGWDELYTNTVRELGDKGTVRDSPKAPHEAPVKLTDHRYGLHLTFNTDWFGLFKNRPHSTGPIYITINDFNISERFQQVNVICPCIMPGPSEPTPDQLNNLMEPSTREMRLLKNGEPPAMFLCISMEIHGQEEPEDIYADYICNNCDTPAARRVSGQAGHSSDIHPCPYCDIVATDIGKESSYGIDAKHVLKKDDELLYQAYQSRTAPPARQKYILKHFGMRWSTLNLIPDWLPGTKTALDFMHAVFLGVICHFFTQVLFAAHMFSGAGGADSAKQRLQDCVNSIKWPSHITRLPKNLGDNQSLAKADEWQRLIGVTPVILWVAWRRPDDTIPDTEPSVAPNEKIKTRCSRKRLSLYSAALLLCASVCLFATRAISMAQARTAQEFMSQYCRACIRLNISLVINHHLTEHFFAMIKRLGPLYGWWLFGFERFNGMLEKVKSNGKDGGRMELTLLRNWVQTHLLYELLLSLPADAHPLEREFLDKIIKSEGRERGGMMTQLALFRSEAETDSVKLPKRFAKKPHDFNARDPSGELYKTLLSYVGHLWPDLNLVQEFTEANGRPFVSKSSTHFLPYIRKNGLRYGCHHNTRTQADSYALISFLGKRVPVRIEHIMMVRIYDKPSHVCLGIRRLRTDDNVPEMPWARYSDILGINVSYADRLHALMIVPAAVIEAPVAVIPVYSNVIQKNLWITISYDHETCEPEAFDDDDW